MTKLGEKKKLYQPITVAESLSLQRYWIESFYCQPISSDLVDFDDDGKTQDKIRLFETVTDIDNPITEYQQLKEDRRSSKNDNISAQATAIKKAVFLRELFSVAGIFDQTTKQFDLNAQYGNKSLQPFIDFIKQHPERLAQLFEKSVNEHIDQRPVVQLNGLLKMIGLKNKEARRNRGKDSVGALYQIDPESYGHIMEVVERRRVKTKPKPRGE